MTKCKLRLHGMFKEIEWGEFPSIAAAKRYVKQCWDRPYTIIHLRKTK